MWGRGGRSVAVRGRGQGGPRAGPGRGYQIVRRRFGPAQPAGTAAASALREGLAVAAGGSSGNTAIVYHSTSTQLRRAGVRSLTPGAALTWVNGDSAPELAQHAREAAAKAAGAAAVKRKRAAERLQAQHGRTAAAGAVRRAWRARAAAAAGAGRSRVRGGTGPAASENRPTKLLRIGSGLYSVTAQGLRRAEAPTMPATAAAGAATSAQEARPVLPPGMVSAPPALVRGGSLRSRRTLASSALARSLRNVRARALAQRAAEQRGLCLHFCR
jgi:hypothetical protein